MSHYCVNCQHHFKEWEAFPTRATFFTRVHGCRRRGSLIEHTTGKHHPIHADCCANRDMDCKHFTPKHDPGSPEARCLDCALRIQAGRGTHYCTICSSTDGVIEVLRDLGGCDNFIPHRTWRERILDTFDHWRS